MSRQILDSVVFDRIIEAKVDRTAFTSNPQYMGTVREHLTKIKLDKSEMGMRDYGTCQHAKEFFETIKLKDGDPYIRVNDTKFTVSAAFVKMIKTLAVEQVNKNEEYSVAISHCLGIVLNAAVKRLPVKAVLPTEEMTVFQKIVVEDFSEWIGQMLGG